MTRPTLEVAGIFRRYGAEYRRQHHGSLSYEQLRVMHAIEVCRTAALGGHVEECGQCGHQRIHYNSCWNRHCNKCQNLAQAHWLERRQSELLPVPYFHVVFSVPAQIAALAYQNKKVVYAILFRAAAETLRTIAADPKRLGAEIEFLAVHTWGQTLEHHPHLHCVVPGGGLAPDGQRWVSCRSRFFLPVKVLSRRFRHLFLQYLDKAHDARDLQFFSHLQGLSDGGAWREYLATARRREWVVYAKPPFGGPKQVLEYLGRYTHRVAISNHRLRQLDEGKVSFRWKDYLDESRQKIVTLAADEFIRRFLLHVLPPGFQRIRQYGLLSNRSRDVKLTLCRELLKATSELLLSAKLRDWRAKYEAVTGESLDHCPICREGRMMRVGILSCESVEQLAIAVSINSS